MQKQHLFSTLWLAFYAKTRYREVRFYWKLKTAFFYLALLSCIPMTVFFISHLYFFSSPPYTHNLFLDGLYQSAITFMSMALLCLGYACIVLIWGAIFKLHLKYQQAYCLAAVSVTPYIFFHTCMSAIVENFHLPLNNLSWLIEILVQFFYLYLAAYLNRRL